MVAIVQKLVRGSTPNFDQSDDCIRPHPQVKYSTCDCQDLPVVTVTITCDIRQIVDKHKYLMTCFTREGFTI